MAYDPKYAKKWRFDRDRGITRFIDPTPTREHIHDLLNAGASKRAIADKAGVSPSVIARISNQQQPHIRRDIAARILKVTPEAIFNRTGLEDFVPDFGAKRRIRALNAIGHNSATIAAHMGEGATPNIPRNIANNPGRWMSRLNYERTLAAYEALWNVPGTCPRVKGQARRFGYAPPMAWDDDTIDDPNATPDLGQKSGANGGRSLAELVEDVEFLLTHDPMLTAAQIADRLGYRDRSAVQNGLIRSDRRDLLDQLARNADLARPGQANTTRKREAAWPTDRATSPSGPSPTSSGNSPGEPPTTSSPTHCTTSSPASGVTSG